MHNQLSHNSFTTPHIQQLNSPITWLEINKDAFAHNVEQYKKLVSPALFAVVIKSNAYGHGILAIAHLAQNNSNVDYICTVSISEGILLRKSGITKPILVLSIHDVALDEALHYDLELVMYDMQQAQQLNDLAKIYKKKIKVHVKIDTGLSRLGIACNDAVSFIETVYKFSNIILHGIFTHFAESEKQDQSFTNAQIDRFNDVIEKLESKNIIIPLKHTSCSAALSSNVKSHYTFARAGIGIYGLWPSRDAKAAVENNKSGISLKPVLTWKTRIIQLKEVPAGTFVGYNRTFCSTKTLRIATVPVGYWDGYDRKLSNKSCVVINGQRAPLIGTIAMNLMMIDVTGLSVQISDEVILLGNYQGVTADELAERCSTINYEFVTRINPLLLRKAY